VALVAYKLLQKVLFPLFSFSQGLENLLT
jgi:hypothetical protein